MTVQWIESASPASRRPEPDLHQIVEDIRAGSTSVIPGESATPIPLIVPPA